MKLKNFQIDWSMFPNPCYDPQGRYGDCPATFMDLMNDDRIPPEDRVWAFAVCTEIGDHAKRMAAVRFVRETPIGDGRFVVDMLTDQRSIDALDVAERYAKGEASDSELAAARADALAAARYAAMNDALAAARYAARYAAMNDAWAAAWAAAMDSHIAIIKSMIEP